MEGEYEQKKKEEEEEEPPEEEGEDAVPKPKFNLIWKAYTNIAQSAHLVNSVE